MEEQTTINPAVVSQATMTADAADIEKNKLVSALAYLGILFFLPLVVDKESSFGKFHANQGLLLFIFSIAVAIAHLLPLFGGIIYLVGSIASFVFLVMGIMNALKGQMKPLPLIGNYTIIK